MPSGHSVQQSAVPVQSGRCRHPSRTSPSISPKKVVCASGIQSRGRLLPYPTNIVIHHNNIVVPKVATKFLGCCGEQPVTQHTHRRQHAVCPLATRHLPAKNPVLHGLSRAPPWLREKASRRIPTRRMSTSTPPLVLKTTATCHPLRRRISSSVAL